MSGRIYLAFVFVLLQVPYFICQCEIPKMYRKKIFSIEDGLDTSTTIGTNFLLESKSYYDANCFKVIHVNRSEWNNVNDITLIFKNKTNSCYFCYDFIWRSDNVLQYRKTQCLTESRNVNLDEFFKRTCNSLTNTEWETGFVENKEDYSDYNCKSIIEGVFSFEYRITSSTGVCQSPDSYLRACQRQGSPLRDNSVFKMRFGYCPNFQEISVLQDPNIIFGKENIFYCYARWVDNSGNIFAAIGYDIKESRYRFRCMTTRIDQQKLDNSQDWGITNNADCKKLFSYKESDIRLYLKPDFDPETQITELQSSCRLPTNFSGHWFYPSEYYTTVTINSTSIVMKRRLDSHMYEDIFFSCKQMQDNRYLMTVITKGKCEIDYMCFEFLPRHQNIIRFRMGRPYPLYYKDKDSLGIEYEGRLFREACYWSSFTLNYIEWTYEYFILNPPIPINCPIQGKYMIIQKGQIEEHYTFKVPGGMTPRPWMQVLCEDFWQGNIQACLNDPKVLQLDSQKCWRLDYTARPYSEYNVVDNYLTCVGYWMEDTKSFLITHDKEDPVLENFRCWVYKRLSFNNYVMSRSRGSRCEKIQTAESSKPSEGASLLLELTQDEYLFDVCPMAYDDGQDPYANNAIMEVFSKAERIRLENIVELLFFTILIFL